MYGVSDLEALLTHFEIILGNHEVCYVDNCLVLCYCILLLTVPNILNNKIIKTLHKNVQVTF